MGMALPSTGDIITEPLSMPPRPSPVAFVGLTGAAVACGAGAGACFFGAAF
jgi:hypothetical protein